jgi:hypothetical protein
MIADKVKDMLWPQLPKWAVNTKKKMPCCVKSMNLR